MQRQFFTASDIIQLSREQKSSFLLLGPEDVITHEAEDVAAALGLRLERQKASGQSIQREVDSPALPPLISVQNLTVAMEPFGTNAEAHKANVRLKDVITSGNGSPMSSGYMALDKGEFHWTLTYDEIDIVLEGELVITRGTQVIKGNPGDTLYIPKGSEITFGTPSHVRFVYVTYPADWNKT